MKTSLRRLAITVGVWMVLAIVLAQLPSPAWAIWVLNVVAGLTVIGILLEIREGGHREPDGFPVRRSVTAAATGESFGTPRRFSVDANTTKEKAVRKAKGLARVHADSVASGNPRAAQRMLDAMPTNSADLRVMTVMGGLPFDPRDTLVLPAGPISTELDELIREYEQTYIRIFSIRLRARLEAKSTRQEWLAQRRQSGRAAADELPDRDRRRLLRQVRAADPEEWADMDPYQQAFSLGLAERIEELESAQSESSS